jgi:hypothetical protein
MKIDMSAVLQVLGVLIQARRPLNFHLCTTGHAYSLVAYDFAPWGSPSSDSVFWVY